MSAEQKLIAIEEISEENAPAIYVAGGTANIGVCIYQFADNFMTL